MLYLVCGPLDLLQHHVHVEDVQPQLVIGPYEDHNA